MASFAYINVGQFPNDQTGDTIRTAFIKINANYANLAYISNVLTNVSVIEGLANANVLAVPNSFVIRDANANGYFADVSINGWANVNVLSVDNAYQLPTQSALTGQTIIAYANGETYWGNISAGTAPGSNREMILNSGGVFGAAANMTSDGTNLTVGGTIGSQGGIIAGPLVITAANATPVINLATGINQLVQLNANVGSGGATVLNPVDGQEYTFIILQGATGPTSNLTWTWPSNFYGGGNISPASFNAYANTYASQKFLYSQASASFYATVPQINSSY